MEIYEPCIHTGVSFTGDRGTDKILISIPKIRNEWSYTSNAFNSVLRGRYMLQYERLHLTN